MFFYKPLDTCGKIINGFHLPIFHTILQTYTLSGGMMLSHNICVAGRTVGQWLKLAEYLTALVVEQ